MRAFFFDRPRKEYERAESCNYTLFHKMATSAFILGDANLLVAKLFVFGTIRLKDLNCSGSKVYFRISDCRQLVRQIIDNKTGIKCSCPTLVSVGLWRETNYSAT